MAKASTTSVLPLPSLIRAAAWDAGNQSMVAAGRKKWNAKDYGAACETQNRLRSATYGEGRIGCIKFGIAEQLESVGYLTLSMKAKDFFGTLEEVYQFAGVPASA